MNLFNDIKMLLLLTLCEFIVITLASSEYDSNNKNMTLPKVFIGNPSVPKVAYDVFDGYAEVITSSGYDRASILKNISGADALFWAGGGKIDREILEAAGPKLKVIGLMSAGYDHVDLKELKARGILLSNTPGVLSNAVADIAVALALGASRNLNEGRKHIEDGTWQNYFDPQWMVGQDITGSTIGIIGLGNIGRTIAKRLKGFDVAKILYTGHKEKPEGKELGAEFCNLDLLIKQSDFIFVSVPLTNETRRMCNEEFFSKMKKNAIFINISRGQMVDQDALIKALKTRQIFAAGLDVMEPEPLNKDSELLKLPNLVLTPHIGSATINTRKSMAELTAKNILRGLTGDELLTPVKL